MIDGGGWWDRSELLAADLTWLVRLEWAGRVVHLAPQRVTATDPETGYSATWRPGVEDFSWSEALDLFSLSPASRSLTLTIRPNWLDVPALIADRQDLHQCTARIYRHIIGGRSVLYFSGRVRDYTYEAHGSPVEISIDANPWDDSGNLTPEAARVDSTTWPTAASKTNGERYPIVIGQPGVVGSSVVPAVPAYAVQSSGKWILIAGHKVEASTVTLYEEGNSDSPVVGPVVTKTDGAGRLVSVADVDSFAGINYSPDSNYRTAWHSGAGLTQEGGAAIRSAGDALRWAVRQSSAPWDLVSVEVAAGLLEGYAIDAGIVGDPAEGLTPWEWIASHLLPLLPVSIHGTARGLGVHVWPLGRDPVASLTRGARGVSRVSRVQSQDRTELLTSSALRYAYDGEEKAYSQRVAAVSQEQDAINGGEVHRGMQAGRLRYGPGVEEGTTSDVVYRAGTARAVVAWRAQLLGLPSWSVSYELPTEWGWLRLGDQITITDSEIGWSSRLAVIQGVQHLPGGRLTVALLVQDSA